MLSLIYKLEEIKANHPELTYREIIKGVMSIPDFIYEHESTIISLLSSKYDKK